MSKALKHDEGKSVTIAYLLWLPTLVGVAGLQHFYLEKYLRGFLWLFTFGLLGFGSLWDFFTLVGQVRKVNSISHLSRLPY